jgi:hypothetical protein
MRYRRKGKTYRPLTALLLGYAETPGDQEVFVASDCRHALTYVFTTHGI